MANRITQEVVLVAQSGTPAGRLTQVVVLVVQLAGATVSDSTAVSDSVSLTVSTDATISVSDSSAVSDASGIVVVVSDPEVVVSDISTVSDLPTISLGGGVSVADSTIIGDTTTVRVSAPRVLVVDGITITDVANATVPVDLNATTGIASSAATGTGMALAAQIDLGVGIVRGEAVYGATPGYDESAMLGRTMAVLGAGDYQLFIGGIDRTAWMMESGANIRKALGSPTTANFKLRSAGTAYRPLIDHEVIFYVYGQRRFGGHVKQVTEEPIGQGRTRNHIMMVSAECLDYTGVLERRIVSHDYRDEPSLRVIVTHAVRNFLDGERVRLAFCSDATLTGEDLQVSDITVREFFDRLADKSGYTWRVDQWANIYFEEFSLTVAPFRIGNINQTWMNPRMVRQGKNIRTRQGVRSAVIIAGTRIENFSVTPTFNWRLDYPISISTLPIVTIDTVSKIVVRDTERALYPHDFFYMPDEAFIWKNPANPPLTGATLQVTYAPTSSDVVWQSDQAAIAADAARSGNSGRIEVVSEGGEITDEDDGTDIATALLRRGGPAVFTVDAKTDRDGLEPGQLLDIDTDEPHVKGPFLVEEVSSTEIEKTIWRSSFKASMSEPLMIISVTNTTPVRIETEFIHGLVDYQLVSVYAVEGCTAANVENMRVRVIDTTHFNLLGVAGNGVHVPYTGYMIGGMPAGIREISDVIHTVGNGGAVGSGNEPQDIGGIMVTVSDRHEWPVVVGDRAYILNHIQSIYGDAIAQEWLAGQVVGSGNGVAGTGAGITNGAGNGVNTPNHILVPTTETTVTVGPVAPVPILATITDITGSGVTPVVVTFDIAHGLSTNQVVAIQHTNSAALNDQVHAITVTGTTTLTLNNTSAVTVSDNEGTLSVVPTGIRLTSITGAGGASEVAFVSVAAHGLVTDQRVSIAEAPGWDAIRGVYIVTITGASTGTLQGIYTTGSASGGVMVPWPAGGILYTGGGGIAPNFGLSRLGLTSTDGINFTSDSPHGFDAYGDPLLTIWSVMGSDFDLDPTRTAATTFTIPSPGIPPGNLPSGFGASLYGTPGGGNTSDHGSPRTGTNPRRQLGRVIQGTRGRRNRALDRVVFILGGAIPGYSSAPLVTGRGLASRVVERDGRIISVIANARTPADGAAIVVDINLDGVSIFDPTKLVFPQDSTTVRRYSNLSQRGLRVRANQELTIDIDQVGSVFAGCDMTVIVLIAVTGSV